MNKAKGLQGCEEGGSLGVTSHIPGSVRSAREYEGVNLHTPKVTLALGRWNLDGFQKI
jgi:hypothetical protein